MAHQRPEGPLGQPNPPYPPWQAQHPPQGMFQVSLGPLEAKFDRMLSLMEKQTQLTEMTFREHGEKLETLRQDALKNDQPFELRELKDQQTWGGLNKEAASMTKEAVGEWKDLMGVSLIFNAIFLAIVTAFIVPVLQDLQTPASNSSPDDSDSPALFDPHRQAVIQQWIAFFQTSAFAVSIFNSALCVLGTQWGARLVARIDAGDNHEMTRLQERRKATGKKWLFRLMGLLFSSLLLSILLFMVAFLLQAWIVAYAETEPRPVLIAAAAVVTTLVFATMVIVVATTYHAVQNKNSPFETPLSNILRLLLRRDTRKTTETTDMAQFVELKSDESSYMETLRIYAGVVLKTSDTEVLEKAVPSFEYLEWRSPDDADGILSAFKAIHARFMASDTSLRVKETVFQQLVAFAHNSDRAGDAPLVRWCRNQCDTLCSQSRELHVKYFPSFVSFTSVAFDNSDLGKVSKLPYEECMSGLLASYAPDEERGDRHDVFESALRQCDALIRSGRSNDVAKIIAINWPSILKSLIRSPFEVSETEHLFPFIARGRERMVLQEISNLISELPPSNSIGIHIFEFLELLSPLLPNELVLPSNFNLSRVLFMLLRDEKVTNVDAWRHYSETLIFYLDRGAFHQLSDIGPAYPVLVRCRSDSQMQQHLRDRAAFYLSQYAPRFSAMSNPSIDDRNRLISGLSIFAGNLEPQNLNGAIIAFVAAVDYWNLLLFQRNFAIRFRRDEQESILRSLMQNPIVSYGKPSLASRSCGPHLMSATSCCLWNSLLASESDALWPLLTLISLNCLSTSLVTDLAGKLGNDTARHSSITLTGRVLSMFRLIVPLSASFSIFVQRNLMQLRAIISTRLGRRHVNGLNPTSRGSK
ncbi:hypothetical protein SISNIDRAFT_226475 [Sistotremastrum niveocremeum HHB9708]|uniref:DUF6535 domain-containing protein n=1 Tax=Sistotremastrum niveocremeum HHB9708 TaxID=1314777 RepID=A0A164QAT5_9AGAM|nr:hypothetical protein SISNIDRAFT_226475 [Sistotremastrum niveocremeum HHB9708]